MLISDTLTNGQVTFILRVAIQIIHFAGVFLLGLIILASGPRVASFSTHDILNRIVGKITATSQSVRWIFRASKDKRNEPLVSTPLILAVFLLTIYAIIVSAADIGFLGFYACSAPLPTTYDLPGSVNSRTSAEAVVRASMVQGVDPGSIQTFRCDASHIVEVNANVTMGVCDSWTNGTYGDREHFKGLNKTDTERLSLRQMKTWSRDDSSVYMVAASVGPGPTLIQEPIIERGVAIIPDETGVRAIFGMPQLENQQQVHLDRTLALEADMGCVSLGMATVVGVDNIGGAPEMFALEWKKTYWGPENMRETLVKYGGHIRDTYRVLFDEGKAVDGLAPSFNDSFVSTGVLARVQTSFYQVSLANVSDTYVRDLSANCSTDLRAALGIPYIPGIQKIWEGQTCDMLELSGALSEGSIVGKSRFLCAVSQQVNTVSALVMKDQQGNITAEISRLPSDIHLTQVDRYFTRQINGGNDTLWQAQSPYLRYTLSDNTDGPMNHYTFPFTITPGSGARNPGFGSPGTSISQLAATIMRAPNRLTDNESLQYLGFGRSAITLGGDKITRWAGQFGAPFINQSISLNGWAAEDSPLLAIESTGGKPGTCYKPAFAASFLPLIVAATFITIWGLMVLLRTGMATIRQLEDRYGGLAPMQPLVAARTGARGQADTLLAWEREPEHHLQPLAGGQPIYVEQDPTAAGYLKQRHTSVHGPWPSDVK